MPQTGIEHILYVITYSVNKAFIVLVYVCILTYKCNKNHLFPPFFRYVANTRRIIELYRNTSIFIENITYRTICATLQLQDSYVVQIDSVTQERTELELGEQSHMLPFLHFLFPIYYAATQPRFVLLQFSSTARSFLPSRHLFLRPASRYPGHVLRSTVSYPVRRSDAV